MNATEDLEQQKALLEWAMKKSQKRLAAWLDLLDAEQNRRAWVKRIWKRFKIWILEKAG